MTTDKYADQKRADAMQRFALAWLRQHRPDVEEAVREEALKLYPLKSAKKNHKRLPESLFNLK
jgi:hypothetical protein